VRLAYLHEAGISKTTDEPYLVVAGIILHGDEHWRPVGSWHLGKDIYMMTRNRFSMRKIFCMVLESFRGKDGQANDVGECWRSWDRNYAKARSANHIWSHQSRSAQTKSIEGSAKATESDVRLPVMLMHL
jgi:hypothetical protein